MLPLNTRRSVSPVSNSANFMLDDPPLIVRMRDLAEIVFVIVFSPGGAASGSPIQYTGLPGATLAAALRERERSLYDNPLLSAHYQLASERPCRIDFTGVGGVRG